MDESNDLIWETDEYHLYGIPSDREVSDEKIGVFHDRQIAEMVGALLIKRLLIQQPSLGEPVIEKYRGFKVEKFTRDTD